MRDDGREVKFFCMWRRGARGGWEPECGYTYLGIHPWIYIYGYPYMDIHIWISTYGSPYMDNHDMSCFKIR